MKILFLYLKAFSFTGGIEKFNRSLLKALHELSVDGVIDADALSTYDSQPDEKYFPAQRFFGYEGVRPLFVLGAFFHSYRYGTLIIGHINLAVIGYLIKKMHPSKRLILVAHGIEIWKTLSGFQKKLLERADLIFAVSNFTRRMILEYNPQVRADKILVFPNTIDPYVVPPKQFSKPDYLLNRYKVAKDTPILLTVTRLASSEKYKGYDGIIALLPELLKVNPDIKYFICGKADVKEKERLELLIQKHNVSHAVRLLGFIDDEELTDHYLLADVFVMQSRKEGFGIVFIEALACGRKVIGGNKDGSVRRAGQRKIGTFD